MWPCLKIETSWTNGIKMNPLQQPSGNTDWHLTKRQPDQCIEREQLKRNTELRVSFPQTKEYQRSPKPHLNHGQTPSLSYILTVLQRTDSQFYEGHSHIAFRMDSRKHLNLELLPQNREKFLYPSQTKYDTQLLHPRVS